MMYERTYYSITIRYMNRVKQHKLHVCDKCNPLSLSCKYCPLRSEFHAALCNMGAFLDKVLK